MTVEELRKLLLTAPDDALVVLSRDSEGDGYSPLVNAWQGFYEATATTREDRIYRVYGTEISDRCHEDERGTRTWWRC